ncbi:MAG: phosphoribosylglycinamide formyltransferase [Euryarchaeota archaeon]|nr:phosphoribosylglycinamide formyltransferase [Euryarchaeota archaeon]OUV25405.1 MAG: phosphoribosylglycinamide formyltransferase [Euryarchaeota archaeon TMED97]|tara:strand:- start:40062 stop:40700 length:639 start_codon:yes stop_codon:yes gene_type:complete
MEKPYILPRRASIDKPLRIAVFISGSGSGLNALLNYQQTPRAHITKLIISDNINAHGLKYGYDNNIKTKSIPLPDIFDKNRQRILHEGLINIELINSKVELIVLSGYMRILTPSFVAKWKGRIINIHPSLLPDFPGVHAHRDVIQSGVKISGCTVHLVDSGVDTGMILAQREVKIIPGETIQTLQDKIKKIEHEIYPKTLDLLCEGQYHPMS